MAQASFDAAHAAGIGELITRYSMLVARRKPELVDQDSFALGEGAPATLDGGEFGAIVAEWQALEQRMLGVKAGLPADQHDAYYQLIEYPIAAVSTLYQLYYAAAWNKRLAARNDARANVFADMVETTFERDKALTQRYHAINGGKWEGMMNQVHMSYVIWNDPTQQSMPSISRVGSDTPPDRIARSIAFAPPAAQTPGVIALEAPHVLAGDRQQGAAMDRHPRAGTHARRPGRAAAGQARHDGRRPCRSGVRRGGHHTGPCDARPVSCAHIGYVQPRAAPARRVHRRWPGDHG